MTAAETTCYRHPDRATGRRCTRCGRYTCPMCLRDAAVGAQCVECVRAGAPSGAQRWAGRWRGQSVIVTKCIIGVTVGAYVLTTLLDRRSDGLGSASEHLVLFGPAVRAGEWWRLGSNALVHFGPMHLFFNMLLLWLVGQVLEPAAGRLRYLLLYVVSVLGGAAGALVATPAAVVGGASGGVFGLAAGATVATHRQGVRFWDTGFGPLLVINLVFNLFTPNVSIGGHLGGLVAGALATEAMIRARRAGRPELGIVGAVAVGAIALVVAFAAI